MSSPPSPSATPLTDAAAAFERELARYEKLAAELGRTTVRSQKTLSRTQRLLHESSDCEAELGKRLRALLEAMNGSRERQQRCMDQTLAAAKGLQSRANEFTALLERVNALGARATETSEPALRALAESQQSERGDELLRSLEELGDRMVGIIHEADEILNEAQRGDWPDISRDVNSLKHQVQAAQARLVQACTGVGSRVLS